MSSKCPHLSPRCLRCGLPRFLWFVSRRLESQKPPVHAGERLRMLWLQLNPPRLLFLKAIYGIEDVHPILGTFAQPFHTDAWAGPSLK